MLIMPKLKQDEYVKKKSVSYVKQITCKRYSRQLTPISNFFQIRQACNTLLIFCTRLVLRTSNAHEFCTDHDTADVNMRKKSEIHFQGSFP